MNKFRTSFVHTYVSKLRSPSFLIATGIMVVFILLAANADRIISLFQDDADILVEVDASEDFYALFKETIHVEDERFTFTNDVSDELADDVVIVDIQNEHPVEATLRATDDIPNALNSSIRTALDDIQRMQTLEEMDISSEDMAALNQPADLSYDIQDKDVTVTEDGQVISVDQDISPLNLIILNLGLFIMFFTVINYASQIGTEIAMEKSSRVIELIVSSMPPVKHLIAKILAMFLIALTQLLIFAVVGILAFMSFDFHQTLGEFGIEGNSNTLPLIGYTFIYMILGMFLYLAIASLLGSFISRMEDLQQGIMPITMLTLAGFYIGIFNAMTGENMLTTVTSYIPFMTPFVMPLRAMHDPGNVTVQIIGIAIMIVSILIALWFAARVYRGSVLSTEKGIVNNMKRVFKRK